MKAVYFERIEFESAERRSRDLELLIVRLANFASHYGRGRRVEVELRQGVNFAELRGEVTSDALTVEDRRELLPDPQKLPGGKT